MSASSFIGTYDAGQTTASGGFAWYASMVNGVNDWMIPLLNQQGDVFGHSLTQIMVHVVFYVALMTVGSMVFAKFWIDTTNMGTKDVAKQIERTGMQIPVSVRIRKSLRRSSRTTFLQSPTFQVPSSVC
jgi:preprotein translocase subunit SecY